MTRKDMATVINSWLLTAYEERKLYRNTNDKENLSNVEGQILAFGQVLRLLGVQDDRERD